MSQTFKQFLEGDSLGMLPYELFFRKEVRLSNEDAKKAVEWAVKAGQTDAPHMKGDTWDHLIDWAINEYEKENPGKDFYKLSNNIGIGIAIKAMIARVMRNRYRLELMNAPVNEDALNDTPGVVKEGDKLDELSALLALRKELNISKSEATELLAWLRNEIADLDQDIKDVLYEVFHHRMKSIPQHDMDEFLRSWTIRLIRDRYKLDITS